MKTLILALLIPCQIFCCQDCVVKIQEKIDHVSVEIIHEVNKGKHHCNNHYLNYLYGLHEGYWECLHIIEHQGS